MTYTKQTWVNGPLGGTPISAERLSHIEDGIEAVELSNEAELVTLDAAAFHKSGDESAGGIKTFTGSVIIRNDAVIDVRGQSGWDPIAAANDVAFGNAHAAAIAAGGGRVLLPPELKIASQHIVGNGVDIVGRGSRQDGGASLITCTTAPSGIAFGDDTPTSGGISGGFKIDGGTVANDPLIIGQTVGRTFAGIDVADGVNTNLVLNGTQNCLFTEVNLEGTNTQDGCHIDKGAGSNVFLKCELGRSQRYHLHFTQTGTALAGEAPYPHDNSFIGCLIEYDQASGGVALIHGGAGVLNRFTDCTIVSSGESGSPLTLVKVDSLISGSFSVNWHFQNCLFQYNSLPGGTVGVDIGNGCSVVMSGVNYMNNMDTAFKFPTSGATGTVLVAGAIQSVTLGALSNNRLAVQNLMIDLRSTPSRLTMKNGEWCSQTAIDDLAFPYPTSQVNADGSYYFGSGTTALDQAMYRIAGGMHFSHKVCANDGIGVGNSVASTAARTKSREMEVFDAFGASLGYIDIKT